MVKRTIQERKAQLEKQLEDLKEAEKKAKDERYIIIGRVIDSECQTNNNLKGTLDTLLKSKLKKAKERAVFNLPKIEKGTIDQPPKIPNTGT